MDISYRSIWICLSYDLCPFREYNMWVVLRYDHDVCVFRADMANWFSEHMPYDCSIDVLLFLLNEIGHMNVLYVPMIEKLWVLLIYIGVLGNDILISPWYKLRISNTLTLKCFSATTYWTFKLYDCSYDVSVNVPLIWHVDVLFDNISWAFLICMDVSVWHMNIS